MSSSAEADRKTCQILIIEDDQDDAFLLKRALNAAALENGVALGMTHNVNGLDALGSVARSDILSRLPAVIIVDLNMPVLDGGRFLDFLRADMQLRAVPAVVLTTSTEKPVHAQALASGGQRGVFQTRYPGRTGRDRAADFAHGRMRRPAAALVFCLDAFLERWI